MAVTFNNVYSIRIPQGDVQKITNSSGTILWTKTNPPNTLRMGGIPNSMTIIGNSVAISGSYYYYSSTDGKYTYVEAVTPSNAKMTTSSSSVVSVSISGSGWQLRSVGRGYVTLTCTSTKYSGLSWSQSFSVG